MIRRCAGEDDARFVFGTWLDSHCRSGLAKVMTPRRLWDQGASAGRAPASQEYYDGQRALIARLLATSNVSIAEAEDGLVDGFICREWSEPVLHYVYVRRTARQQGVARALVADLAQQPTLYTHLTPDIDRARLPAGWRYSPYPLMLRSA